MTTTKTIYSVDTSTTIVTAVPMIDQDDLVLVGSSISADGLDREAVYQLASGDEDYPMALRIAIYRKPSANGGMGENVLNVKLMTTATEVDDSSGDTITEGRAIVSLTVTLPGDNPVFDGAQFRAFVGHMYSLMYTAVDGSNIPDSVVTDKFKFGVANAF